MANDLKVILTSHCNYDCYFCRNLGFGKYDATYRKLTPEDYVFAYNVHSHLLGWNGITLSGGEPLVYRDFDTLVEKLASAGARITVITNGSLLNEHLPTIQHLTRINVPIHSLNPLTHKHITGRNTLSKVCNNLRTVRALFPDLEIHLNTIPTHFVDWSGDTLRELLNFSDELEATLEFVELFPRTTENPTLMATIHQQLLNLGFLPSQSDDERITRYTRQIPYRTIRIAGHTCAEPFSQNYPPERNLYLTHDGFIPAYLYQPNGRLIDVLSDIKRKNMQKLSDKLSQLLEPTS